MNRDEILQALQDMYEDEQIEFQLTRSFDPTDIRPCDVALAIEHEPWKGSGKRKMRKTK